MRDQALERERLESLQQKQLVRSKGEFDLWKKKRDRQFRLFKKEIYRQWGEFLTPGRKRWVEYSADGSSVFVVDFEKGTVTVKVRASVEESAVNTKKKLAQEVKRVISSCGSIDELPVEGSKLLDNPVLAGQLALSDGSPVSEKDAVAIVEGTKIDSRISSEQIVGRDEQRISLVFPLAPDHLKKRMEPFLPFVDKYCVAYGLEPELVLAIIHSESYFNPLARSEANAVGIMQLVPEKGGADAYLLVTSAPGIPDDRYLLDPENNIRLGCAYLHLLSSRYFGAVNSREKNRYCTIAGYNTGPGNVAWAFTGSVLVDNAVLVINGRSDDAVYRHLLRSLPYAETRFYLQTVVERMKLYRR